MLQQREQSELIDSIIYYQLLDEKNTNRLHVDFLLTSKAETPYLLAFPAFFVYSSSLLTPIFSSRHVPKNTISCGVFHQFHTLFGFYYSIVDIILT